MGNQSTSSGCFEHFCQATSLHGWKFLASNDEQTNRRPLLKIGWIAVVVGSIGVAAFFLSNSFINFFSSTVMTSQDTTRASLKNVFFPSVTLCNINQGRSSLFHAFGLSKNKTLLNAVLRQAYFGSRRDLPADKLEEVSRIFAAEEVITKGLLADYMFQSTPYRNEAIQEVHNANFNWSATAAEPYVREAGWYFKTLAVQEVGENVVLRASYQRVHKEIETYTSLLPFFGTDYGLCTLIKPQITFDRDLEHVPFDVLMRNFTQTIKPGIQLGKENGLSILLDAEVYDYGFSPHRGEGFKLAIHHHMDQPIMALSDVDISPGFVTQLSVTPTLTVTTEEARNRFTPDERVCYFDDEFRFKYLPQELYRYGLSNCLFAATYDEILAKCSCVPFFHTMAYDDYPRICAGKGLLCMNKILSDIGSHTHVNDINGVRRQCHSPCTDQTNAMAVTTSVFPNLNTFRLGPEFCILFRKLQSTCKTHKRATLTERYPELCETLESNVKKVCLKEKALPMLDAQSYYEQDDIPVEDFTTTNPIIELNDNLTRLIYKYARENLALVNVYIKDPAVTQVVRDQKVPLIWFVANIGGILGLTMGMSLVTIFEIMHHVAMLFFRTGAKSIASVRRTMTIPSMQMKQRSGGLEAEPVDQPGTDEEAANHHIALQQQHHEIPVISSSNSSSGEMELKDAAQTFNGGCNNTHPQKPSKRLSDFRVCQKEVPGSLINGADQFQDLTS